MLPWRLPPHNPQWPEEIDPGKWQQKDPRLDDGCHLLALELLQIAPEKQQKDWNMTTNQILGSTTHLVTVTTRSITSLVGNPYKPLFATGILSVGTSKQFPYQSQSIIQDFRFSQKKCNCSWPTNSTPEILQHFLLKCMEAYWHRCSKFLL